MIILSDSSDECIASFVDRSRLQFYDPKTYTIFDASPCECCGTMSAHGSYVRLDRVSDRLNRALQGYLSVLDFVETTDYNDNGDLECESCC